MIESLPRAITEPAMLVETSHFVVKIAKNHEEIEQAQRLRYEVFNLEQRRGLQDAAKYGIDFDEFDEYCLHLIVIEKSSGKVIGTYRAHLGRIANCAKGFYSSKEYDIQGLYKVADKCIELGRTCVSPEYRSGSVIALLWGGVTEIVVRAKLTYMLGCVSLETTDAAIGWAMHDYLMAKGLMCRDVTVKPRPGFKLVRPSGKKIDKILHDENVLKANIPPLFKGYLRLGGQICGEPALDKEFNAIDFFILINVDNVPARYKRHFNYRDTKD